MLIVCGGGDDTGDSFYNEVKEILGDVGMQNGKEKVMEEERRMIMKWRNVKRPDTGYGDLNIRNSNLNTVLKSAKYRNGNLFKEKKTFLYLK